MDAGTAVSSSGRQDLQARIALSCLATRPWAAAGILSRRVPHSPFLWRRAVAESKADRPHKGVTRLLMTTDTLGGVWSHSLELAHALAPLGIQVALAALGGRPGREAREEARAIPGLTLHESEYRLPWMREPWDEVARGGAWLLELWD